METATISKYAGECSDIEWAIGLNRLSMEIIGVWPEVEEDAQKKLLSDVRVFIIFVCTFVSATVPAIWSLTRIWGDMTLMIDNLQFSLPLITAQIKLVTLWWRRAALLPILRMLAEDWKRTKLPEERKIMVKCAGIARTLTIVGYVMMVLSYIILAVLPALGLSLRQLTNITDPGKPFPLQTYYAYNVYRSPHFEIMYMTQSTCLAIAAMTYTAVDSWLAVLVLHVCAQLENLRSRLLNISKVENYRHTISYIVKEHVRLIRSVSIIDDTFTLMLLGLLVYFSVLFCLYGFLIISTVDRGDHLPMIRFVWLVSVLLNTLAHMCAYCFVGEFLVSQSEGIYHAACSCDWYTFKAMEAKDLTLIIIQATKPLYLTAGKMFPMTMAMFCGLLKTSAGYVSVLLANRE